MFKSEKEAAVLKTVYGEENVEKQLICKLRFYHSPFKVLLKKSSTCIIAAKMVYFLGLKYFK